MQPSTSPDVVLDVRTPATGAGAAVQPTPLTVPSGQQPHGALRRAVDSALDLSSLQDSKDGVPELAPGTDADDIEEGGAGLSTAPESGVDGSERRPRHWHHALIIGASVLLIGVILGTSIGSACGNVQTHGVARCALRCATSPLIFCLAMFSVMTCVGTIVHSLGPVAHATSNSYYYSANPPTKQWKGALPRVTIQMPVYKESLAATIQPSVESLLTALAAYKEAGGDGQLFVNDDGLQLISDADREERVAFYETNDIAYIARPGHNVNRYTRAGRFKKASNMNFCLGVSRRVSALMQEQGLGPREALEAVRLDTAARRPSHAFLAGGDTRMGDFILLVDSDTRVPRDCILPVVTELLRSPHVAFTQHYTTPLQISWDYYESANAQFTTMIYNAIKMCVSGGDVAPLVGHNAFLRWEALQKCAFVDPADGVERFWSEAHVAGYIGRYVTYTGPDMKEGLSLNVHDEISRMRKYAFGCSELVFHPLIMWPVRGPFTKLFRSFLLARATPLATKISVTSYINIYVAIAAAWLLGIGSYFASSMSPWFAGAFENAFDISMSCLVIFAGFSPIGTTLMHYRLGLSSLGQSAWQNMRYSPVYLVFFLGLSFHLSVAFASHLLGYNMSWGITSKEVTATNFFRELRYTFNTYRSMYCLFTVFAIMIVVMTGVIPGVIPKGYEINDPLLILPFALLVGGHLAAPMVLNPTLMLFRW